MRESMVLVGGILVILGMSLASTNYMIDAGVPQKLLEYVSQLVSSQATFLWLLLGFLLVLGAILDIFSAIVLVVPLILPVAIQYGVHPVHLGIVFLATMQLGYITPPVGLNLFIALVLSEVVLVTSCALIKKVLVGGHWGSGHSTPFWSWRHLSYFFAQDCFFAWCKQPLKLTAGTVLSNSVLRLMGCKVGKRTIVASPLQASDWNAVSVGDDCIVNGFLQYHTFENMILRVKRTELREGGAVNFGATVMGGAVIEPETTLLPLGMVLKEMHLPTATYEGSPVEPV